MPPPPPPPPPPLSPSFTPSAFLPSGCKIAQQPQQKFIHKKCFGTSKTRPVWISVESETGLGRKGREKKEAKANNISSSSWQIFFSPLESVSKKGGRRINKQLPKGKKKKRRRISTFDSFEITISPRGGGGGGGWMDLPNPLTCSLDMGKWELYIFIVGGEGARGLISTSISWRLRVQGCQVLKSWNNPSHPKKQPNRVQKLTSPRMAKALNKSDLTTC